MPTPSDIDHALIQHCLSEAYGPSKAPLRLTALHADASSAAFRIDADDGAAYFLELHRKGFDPSVLAMLAFLHHEQGIEAVMAPLLTTNGELSVRSGDFDCVLYPFFEGANAFARALSDAQWTAFGAVMGAVHRSTVHEALSASLPKERYAHHWREGVRRYQRRFINGLTGDDVVKRFFAFWEEHAEDIDTVVYRSEQLASILLERPPQRVPCHADLHAGNVLAGDDGQMRIVGWRTLMLAPKERDLMFIGGGVGHVWNRPEEAARFHEGYGQAEIDAVALAYYRYERIAKNILETCDLMFDAAASLEDREEALRRMRNGFEPNDVVAIAHQSYDAVT